MPITPGWNAAVPKAGGISMGATLDAMGEVIGKIEGISLTMRSPNSVGTMVKYTWALAAREFDTHTNALALSNYHGLHHVYEWGLDGVDAGRLWRHDLSGTGGNRVASYHFISSRRAIPQPDTSDWPEDAVEEYQKYDLGSRRYIFSQKAIVMETGAPVHITPRNGGKIFIPLPKGSYGSTEKGYIWSKEAFNADPGGHVAGNFTRQWEVFWNTSAQKIVEEKVLPGFLTDIEEI